MIPIKLKLQGFLSYKDEAELIFDGFNLACISGENGAGKSTLLDAITWSLFGKARRNDDSVINNASKTADVSFTFLYEEQKYRVQRIKPRGRSATLEFQIEDEGTWKPLTDSTMTETQNQIRQTLHLDYDTFINASFFLQGKADEFTQKNSSQRKEILSTVLGIDMWEDYKERSGKLRRSIEGQIKTIEGTLQEIDEELAQEEVRQENIEKESKKLKEIESQRGSQQSLVDAARQVANLIEEYRKTAVDLEQQNSDLHQKQTRLNAQFDERNSELDQLKASLEKEGEIKERFEEYQSLRSRLRDLDALAANTFDLKQKKNDCEKAIAVEESRLQLEWNALEDRKTQIEQLAVKQKGMQDQTAELEKQLKEIKQNIQDLNGKQADLDSLSEGSAYLKAENDDLRRRMGEMKKRMDALSSQKGSRCPLCGQDLTSEHRQLVVNEIDSEGKELAALFRENKASHQDAEREIKALKKEVSTLKDSQSKHISVESKIAGLHAGMEQTQIEMKEWKEQGEKRLEELSQILHDRKFSQKERKDLITIQKQIEKLGYDAEEHASFRKQEQDLSGIEELHQNLIGAASRLEPIEREVDSIQKQRDETTGSIKELKTKKVQIDKKLASVEKDQIDLVSAEEQLENLIIAENRQRSDLGGAQQMVEVIKVQKARKKDFQKKQNELLQRQTQLKILERSFGRDGVQALLMEEALPQMEMHANDILSRLTSGAMSVEFKTEREYKDKKRSDKMQVLDILISDAMGERSYDLFSGGEAFRINFAIRLALSRVLAQRAGARLQMLVIDEGFGSQDSEGRQKLIEAINLIRPDFEKILVITHIEEFKDIFPARIEVTKTRKGSQVEVYVQ